MPAEQVTTSEIWKPIPMTDGRYEASSFGRIRRIWTSARRPKSGNPLKNAPRQHGYTEVRVSDCRERNFTVLAHRLIANAFHGNCPAGKEINHKNGKKSDNRPDNLEYVTRSENLRHSFRELRSASSYTRWGPQKLTKQDVQEIILRYATGYFLQREIAKDFKIGRQYVGLIVNGICPASL